jgi:hypothetical protein
MNFHPAQTALGLPSMLRLSCVVERRRAFE